MISIWFKYNLQSLAGLKILSVHALPAGRILAMPGLDVPPGVNCGDNRVYRSTSQIGYFWYWWENMKKLKIIPSNQKKTR